MLSEKIKYANSVIKDSLDQYDKEKMAIAFSGGKDGLVLAHLLVKHGITFSFIDTSMYFSKQKEDSFLYAKELGLEAMEVGSMSWKDCIKNEEVYFPQDSKNKYLGVKIRQWKSIPAGIKKTGRNVVFYGRRLKENRVPADIEITKKMIKVCPIRHWTTTDVWQYMLDNNLRIPWIYRTRFAQYLNNAPWHTLIGSKLWCWDIVANTEKAIFEKALTCGLPSAHEYKKILDAGEVEKIRNEFSQSWFASGESTMNPYTFMGLEVPREKGDNVNYYRTDV